MKRGWNDPKSRGLLARLTKPALGGVILALAVGYLLAGWSEDRGLFEVSAKPLLSPTTHVFHPHPSEEEVRRILEDGLIERERLDLLSAARNLSELENRELIKATLRSCLAEQDGEAAYLLALLTENGKEKEGLLHQSARWGCVDAQLLLASRIRSGGSDPAVPDELMDLLDRSAALGDARAQTLLGVLLSEDGKPEAARSQLERARRSGDPLGAYHLGLLLHEAAGDSGVPEIAGCFREAAESGHVPAMVAYALCLEAGYGTTASYTEAKRWMRIASDLENEKANRWCVARGVLPR